MLFPCVVMRLREERRIGLHPLHALLALEEVKLAIAHDERRGIGFDLVAVGEVGGAQAAELRRVALGILGEELAVLLAREEVARAVELVGDRFQALGRAPGLEIGDRVVALDGHRLRERRAGEKKARNEQERAASVHAAFYLRERVARLAA